jgi:DNA-binding GntR family transcriptional regulator
MKKENNYPLPRTMSELIYNELKESIINHKLKANQRINEKEISEYFHVSRTPVREAVLRLAAEGFVQIDSYRRATVKELSFRELSEILLVLGALDRLAIALALDNLTPKAINKLENINAKMEKACSLEHLEKYMDLNRDFHNELWKYVPNQFLQEMLYVVRDKKQRYQYARLQAYKIPGFLEDSIEQHRKMMQMIKERDKEGLQELIVSHRNLIIESASHKTELEKYLKSEKSA